MQLFKNLRGGDIENKGASSLGATSRATALSQYSGGFGSSLINGGNGEWSLDQAVQRGYERVISVFRCVDAISMAQSKLKLVVRQGDKDDGRIVLDEQLRYVLNKHSNTYESAQQFRYRLSSQALLSRKGIFIEIVKNRAGRVAGLHLLDANNVEPIKDPILFVSGYKVKGADNQHYILDPDQIIWGKLKPHPTDPYLAMTPLQAAGMSVDTEYLSRLFNRNFVANDGRPGMLIGISGQINPEDAEELKERIGGNGPASAGRPIVIESDSISVNDLGKSPRDLQYLEGLSASKEDIYLAFGCPESVLGNASGRTFSNADAERLNWWMDTMVPHCDAISDMFDILTTGGVMDDFYVAHDYSVVDVLQLAKQKKSDSLLAEFTAGVISLDTYLMETGRVPLQVPGSQAIWVTAGKIPIGRTDDVTKAAQLLTPVPATPTAPAGMTPQQQSAASEQGAIAGWTQQQAQLANDASARAIALRQKAEQRKLESKNLDIVDAEIVIDLTVEKKVDPYELERAALEAEFIGTTSSWSRQQEVTVTERLGGNTARRGTRHWEGEGKGLKPLDGAYIVNPSKWASEIKADFDPILRRVVQQQLRKSAAALNQAGVIDMVIKSGAGNPSAHGNNHVSKLLGSNQATVEQTLVENLLTFVEKAALAQSARLIKKIDDMEENGSSITDMKSQIGNMVGARSLWKKNLARWVTTSVIEGAKDATYMHAGNFINKQWHSHDDERTRPAHRVADGQEVKANAPFLVGTSNMLYPCDPSAPISQTAGCRCHATFSVAKS